MVKYLTSIDLNRNELKNAVIQNLATAPETPKVGLVYFDTTQSKFGVCTAIVNGDATWAYMLSVAEVDEIKKALNNEITNLQSSLEDLGNKKQNNLVLDNTLAFAEDENKTLGVQTANLTIATADAAGVVKSGDKIAVAEDGTMDLVDGTVGFGKLAEGTVQKESISATGSASDKKLVTEKAVRVGLNAVASAAETSTQIDGITIVRGEDKKLKVAEGGEATGLEAKHFKTGVVVSKISNEGDETKLASDKAVRVAINSAIANVYKIKGSVQTFAKLPESPAVGDVYNIVEADSEHDIKAGDNVVWVGEDEDGGVAAHWDVLSGVVDLSAYSTADQMSTELAKKQHVLESSKTITLVPGEGDVKDKLNVVTSELDVATTDAVGVIRLATTEEVKTGAGSKNAVTAADAKALVKQDIEFFRTVKTELEGKTLSAGKNTISGLSAANVADGKIALGEAEGDGVSAETKDEAVLISEKLVNQKIAKVEAEITTGVKADGTTISRGDSGLQVADNGLTATKLADGSLSLGADETKADAQLVSLAKANELISAAAPGVDKETLELFDNTAASGSNHDIRVKDGGLTVAKMNTNAVSKTISAAESASDEKLATEKAVRDLHNEIAAEAMTLTNKTFDANAEGNALSNVEVADFATGVVQTEVRTAGEGEGKASDTTLVTELAVRKALDKQAEGVAHKKTVLLEAKAQENGMVKWEISECPEDAEVMIKETATGDLIIADIKQSGTTVTISFNADADVEADKYKAIIIG